MEYYSSLDASQLDSETPTIFEIISASQLDSLLAPSLRYILVHYTSKYPYYLLRISNRFDEINLLLKSIIEWYFIKYWQGSFTENFYGLKRVQKTILSETKYNSSKLAQLAPSIIEEKRSLTKLQEIVSIFEITGVSYLNEKFNYWYEIWYPKYITNQLVPKESDKKSDIYKITLKRKFVELYPTVQSVLRAGDFAAILLYLSGTIKSPSLLTHLFQINLSRLNQYDYSKNESDSSLEVKKMPNRTRPLKTVEYLLNLITSGIARPSWKLAKLILGTCFPIAIFALKFLEWWNNSDFASKLAKGRGDILDFTLPAPSVLSKYFKSQEKTKKEYKSGKFCPLCKEEISNPAIIETGYVFCYSCIYNYLQESHKIVSAKSKFKKEEEIFEYSDSDDEEEAEKSGKSKEKEVAIHYDIGKGGRCPITGKKLLGCQWNSLKEEWEIEGIRRLIF